MITISANKKVKNKPQSKPKVMGFVKCMVKSRQV